MRFRVTTGKKLKML